MLCSMLLAHALISYRQTVFWHRWLPEWVCLPPLASRHLPWELLGLIMASGSTGQHLGLANLYA